MSHYDEADGLARALNVLGPNAYLEQAPVRLAEAQVHATLALADAVREVLGLVDEQLAVLRALIGASV